MAGQVRECEVVVVGAGYSGLAAARHLARSGVDVLVLDARHRVGGRSFTDVTAAGFTIDRGGQWIGPTQDHLAALAAELGVRDLPDATPPGRASSCATAGASLYVGLIPTSDPDGAADGIACMLDLDLAAFDVPLDAPWDAPDAAALDAQTLATYFDAHLSSASARSILEVAVKAIFGTGSGELSLLFALFYLHAGGGLTNLARTTGGAQEAPLRRRLPAARRGHGGRAGGPGDPRRPRRDGGPRRRRGRSSAPGWSPPVTTRPTPPPPTARCRVRARRAVFAMAPALCARLAYTPALPGRRDQLCQRMPMGAVTKVHVLYDEPVLARRRPQRPDRRPRARVWAARSTTRPRTRPTAPSSGSSRATTAAASSAPGPRRAGRPSWHDLERAFGPRARTPDRDRRAALARRAVHPGRAGRREHPRGADRAGTGAARARGAAALGRDGDGDAVVRLPRRRALAGPARRRRGAAGAEGRAGWPRLRSCSRRSPSGAPAATATPA